MIEELKAIYERLIESEDLEIIQWHQERSRRFADAAGVPLESVQTHYIINSPRFKYMQVYYAKVDQCPEGAFECGPERHMGQVLTQ